MAWFSIQSRTRLEDAGWDALLEEGHAAGVSDLVADVAADGRAGGGEQDEQEDVGVLRGEHDDHDVGDAGEGERDEGGVDDGDEKESAESEVEEEGEGACWDDGEAQ